MIQCIHGTQNDTDELTSKSEISSRISTTSRAFSLFSSFESFTGMPVDVVLSGSSEDST